MTSILKIKFHCVAALIAVANVVDHLLVLKNLYQKISKIHTNIPPTTINNNNNQLQIQKMRLSKIKIMFINRTQNQNQTTNIKSMENIQIKLKVNQKSIHEQECV